MGWNRLASAAWIRRSGLCLVLALPFGCSGVMLDPVGGESGGANQQASEAGSSGGRDRCAGGVTFTDARLEAAVREALQLPSGPISPERAATLTHLEAWRIGIASLDGVECLVNLSTLYVFDNSIADITPLAKLTTLSDLLLGNNQVTNLAPLAGLINLTTLDVASNQISDIAPLAGLTRLTALDLGTNQITDIRALAELKSLSELLLEYNQVTDLAAIAGLTNLQHLGLNSNPVTDLAPVVASMCPAKATNSLDLGRLPGEPFCDDPNVAALKACGVNVSYLGGC